MKIERMVGIFVKFCKLFIISVKIKATNSPARLEKLHFLSGNTAPQLLHKGVYQIFAIRILVF